VSCLYPWRQKKRLTIPDGIAGRDTKGHKYLMGLIDAKSNRIPGRDHKWTRTHAEYTLRVDTNTNLEGSHRFNTITAIKPKDFAVFNLGKKNFQPGLSFVIGAKAGKLFCVREKSKTVHVGFGVVKKEPKVVES
jgi:hypothetical protein